MSKSLKLCTCGCNLSMWKAMPENDRHAYKVVCAECRLFLKWGAADQFHELSALGRVVPYAEPETDKSLTEFCE